MVRWLRWLLIASLIPVLLSASPVQADSAVVRAVLFYSPSLRALPPGYHDRPAAAI